ncbi:unnamed protein product [Sphenostylis stenocarpa]|uniref:Uncharacterized protein n=1 Tax=Sphenostylis stenocarpa TaxID=92480 RepID=A0AA86RPF5_9FABA|nr:unnamed protein product [Sphenostylis stenocarpa]
MGEVIEKQSLDTIKIFRMEIIKTSLMRACNHSLLPTNGVDRVRRYRTEAFGRQPTNYWQGVFSVLSYTKYFNVDTDVVVNRVMSSLNPVFNS